MNTHLETARRWVIEDRKTDAEVAHLIVVGYDEGPPRVEMEAYVNQARAEVKWWERLEKAYRAGGYLPGIDLVAHNLGDIPVKTLRKQCRDHGIDDWRDLHARWS